ncbi:tetratricopeptide repeat protein [Brevibacillus sp. SYSU BS000544]|uniref:tetratricopeptide repeat protein n=1 Tax=Brevibacillus sp. SYSU BS000544 TaxID=3416443 RepID=UPI003CE49B15
MENNDNEKLKSEALLYHMSKNYSQELEIWRTLYRSDPTNPYIMHNVALALMNNNQLGDSLVLFNYIIENYPNLSRAHNNRAVLLIRMGADLKELIPAFTVSLILSESTNDFWRHFINICNTIAYGLDRDTSFILKEFEKTVYVILNDRFSKSYLDRNQQSVREIIEAYQYLGEYREAFASRRWTKAEISLNKAKIKFDNLSLSNMSTGIETIIKQYLKICRGVFEVLEEIPTKRLSIQQALIRYLGLIEEVKQLENDCQDSAHLRLINILLWFLIGITNMLGYLLNPIIEYNSDNTPKNAIEYLTSKSLGDLGRDLIIFLDNLDKICVQFSFKLDEYASTERINSYRDNLWIKIALLCKSLILNFEEVDIALSKTLLGWDNDQIGDANVEMQRFKSLVERQLYKDIYVGGNPQESIGRGLLQAFLSERSYREVEVRGGQIDLLAFTKNGRILYETKIWRGAKYHEQGFREIEEYLLGEGDDSKLLEIFYVVFDPTKSVQAKRYQGGFFTERKILGYKIKVIIIQITLPTPSKTRN